MEKTSVASQRGNLNNTAPGSTPMPTPSSAGSTHESLFPKSPPRHDHWVLVIGTKLSYSSIHFCNCQSFNVNVDQPV